MSQMIYRQVILRGSTAEPGRAWIRSFSKSCPQRRDQNGQPDHLRAYRRHNRKHVARRAQTAAEDGFQTRPAPDRQLRMPPSKASRLSNQNTAIVEASASKADFESRSIYDTQIKLGATLRDFSSVLLRDLCECPACVDPSTKQKLFSTADIPLLIHAGRVIPVGAGVHIRWIDDVPGYGADHVSHFSYAQLGRLVRSGDLTGQQHHHYTPGPQAVWDAQAYSELADIEYDAYMTDDAVLFQALQQLHKYGLMFLRNVPESERSVSLIGERIGPLKNTFYGYTWDVRSVPEAKNVAYTSQNLGFHMDLMYMHQPPQIQLLHCIRASRTGGASLFTDSYAAATSVYTSDLDAFKTLAELDVNFHYNHPTTHLYHQSRKVFDLCPLQLAGLDFQKIDKFKDWYETGKFPGQPGLDTYANRSPKKPLDILDYLDAVNWSPPFQAPFALGYKYVAGRMSADKLVTKHAKSWHEAAQQFSNLIERPEGIYERLMRPGECVIFDNRRVLHARKAFAVAGVGEERYLRGAYLDRDPFLSKIRVLAYQQKLQQKAQPTAVQDVEGQEG